MIQRKLNGTWFVLFIVLTLALATAPSALAQQKIVYLGAGGAPYQVIAQELVDRFNAENPDIEVEMVWVVGAAADLLEKLQVMVAAGTPPDVFWTHVYIMTDLVQQGIARPLDDLIATDPDFNLDDYFPVAVGDYWWGDHLYGLPGEVTSLALYYNIDMFEAYGVPEPDGTWDWDTLRQAARSLSDPESQRWGLHPPMNHANAYAITWQNGGRYFDDTRTVPQFHQPAVVEAYQWIADLMYVDRVSPPGGAVSGGLYVGFGQSQLAMFYDIPGASTWMQDLAVNWDVAPLPQGKEPANRIATSGYALTAHTQKPDAAWRFLKYMVGESVQHFYLQRGFMIPTLRSLANSPDFLDRYARPKNTQVFIDGLEYARNEEITTNYIAVVGAKDQALLPLWRGEQPAATVMEAVNRAVSAALSW